MALYIRMLGGTVRFVGAVKVWKLFVWSVIVMLSSFIYTAVGLWKFMLLEAKCDGGVWVFQKMIWGVVCDE